MSRVTRRKHVLKEMFEEDYSLPTEQQQIVRVISSRGNNLHEVETASPPQECETFLVSMPTKFRKNVWVKRGDFVLVERIEEGDKVKAEICKILTPEHIKEYTKAGIWPQKFTNKRPHEDEESDENSDMEGDEFVVRNRNRPAAMQAAEEDSDDESDDDDDDDDGDTSSDEN